MSTKVRHLVRPLLAFCVVFSGMHLSPVRVAAASVPELNPQSRSQFIIKDGIEQYGTLTENAQAYSKHSVKFPNRVHSPRTSGDSIMIIDFDDITAPCLFIDAVALRGEYAGRGILFDGQNSFDGGAVLDECSNFFVSGYSPPNFLAFNAGATLSDGGASTDPERIDFSPPIDFISLRAGAESCSGTELTLKAYDSANNIIGTDAAILSPILQELSLNVRGISYVILDLDGCEIYVVDDVAFQRLGAVPTLSEWGLIIFSALLFTAILYYLRVRSVSI